MADFVAIEAKDGIRMTWNVWPGSQEAAALCAVPAAIAYTPLHGSSTVPVLPYAPLRCKLCRSFLNPFCSVDFIGKIWVCPFCFQRNHFPEQYSAISESNLPAELFPDYSTVEYAVTDNPGSPPVFLFVVDTCMIEEELGFLKVAITQAIDMLSSHALVGLITFGTLTHVHELGFTEIPKSYVFKGFKDVSRDHIIDYLALMDGPHIRSRGPGVIAGAHDGLSAKSISRFLVPASESEISINSVFDDLQVEPWPIRADQRATRCTGMALSIAANLLSACVPGRGGRILTFLGGPCTEGLGMVVGKDLTEPIRSHKDLEKNSAPHYRSAVEFYETFSKQLVNQGHVFDLFACSLDQIGVAEMRIAVERTGGLVVLAESFGHLVFKESFKRIFEVNDSGHGLAFNGIFEVNFSSNLRVQGIVGPCASLNKKGQHTSDIVIGQGNTTAWKMNGLDEGTTLSLFFEVVTKEVTETPFQGQQQFFFQFLTYYQHNDGKMRMRATTVARRWVVGSCMEELVSGFDQETAAVIMGRLACWKMETEEEFNAMRWLDKILVHVSSKLGDYQKDDPSSFSLSARLSIFPQFMFNLRRSQFVQVFNNSPDETAYHRMLLNRETVVNSVVMIQPSLISYAINPPPEPVMLDVSSIAVDRILLLDAYFTIVIFHGMNIAQWRKEGYHNLPEHKLFAQMLRKPIDDANEIIKLRFPVPRLVICDQHTSQARFLLAKLNPSLTHKSDHGLGRGSDIIFTDDVSFEVFMEHLRKLAVQL